jgi:hypothetical protein
VRKAAAGALLALVACTDPRARPAPPIVQLAVAPSFVLKSPGTIIASLYAFDGDGLDNVQLALRIPGSTFKDDSLIPLPGDPEITRPIHWDVPGGLPIGSHVNVIARVVDFVGFASTDTLHLTVQDTVSQVR